MASSISNFRNYQMFKSAPRKNRSKYAWCNNFRYMEQSWNWAKQEPLRIREAQKKNGEIKNYTNLNRSKYWVVKYSLAQHNDPGRQQHFVAEFAQLYLSRWWCMAINKPPDCWWRPCTARWSRNWCFNASSIMREMNWDELQDSSRVPPQVPAARNELSTASLHSIDEEVFEVLLKIII
jgi:hypothetical protein